MKSAVGGWQAVHLRSQRMLLLATSALALVVGSQAGSTKRPNVVIFFGDDWGWGDLGANWAPTKALGLTPNLDKLADGGLRFVDFHAGASVCTPSRAALLTGRLGLRTGVTSNFGPSSTGGLPLNETTIAELLKPMGYKTGMIGKWHLGTANGHHPIDRGFESYVGLPYSNDMGCASCQAITFWDTKQNAPGLCPACASGPAPVGGIDISCGRTEPGGACIDALALPIFYNKTITEQPVDLTTVSTQYATAGANFVASAAGKPFFLYVANSHVHVPQNHAARWTGKSTIGPFGDALMEMDWEIGEIMHAVEAAGVAEDTLYLVSGDNGPWECKCNLTGSSGPYVGGWQKANGGGSSRKMTLWEGGHRTVGIAAWTGTIKPGVSHALASTLDFFPTIASLTGATLPSDRVFDGRDLSNLLMGKRDTPRTTLFHPQSGACGTGPLAAARYMKGTHAYKTIAVTGGKHPGCYERPGRGPSACVTHDPPLLFDLSVDPGEERPIDPKSSEGAAVLAEMAQQLYLQMVSVNTTARSVASYASGPEGKAANCCNPAHTECRCKPGDEPAAAVIRPPTTEMIEPLNSGY